MPLRNRNRNTIPNFRKVGGGGNDPDAQAFIDAAGITGETQQLALNQLVLDLKGTGSTTNNTDVWSKLRSVYPFCPTDSVTATREGYKWNLKDPRDLDAAFRITWFNNPTADLAGITGDGVSAYGNTHINPSIDLILNNTSVAMYQDSGWDAVGNTFGVRTGSTANFGGFFSGTTVFDDQYSTSSGRLTGTVTSTAQKLTFIGSRTSALSHVIYDYGISIASNATSGGSLPNEDYYILNQNGIGGYSVNTYQFFCVGEGISANEAKDLDDAITTYNTSLGR